MERVVRGRSFTLYKTFYSDGVATDPTGSPTVVILRDDGTTVTAGATVNEAPVGQWSVTVASADNLLLDTLAVTWFAVVGGSTQQYADTVEVAGDVLFTLAQARALKPLDLTANYTTAAIVEARTMVETSLEDACGVAFVPRYRRETVSGQGSAMLMLAPRLRAVRSVAMRNGSVSTAFTQAQLDTIVPFATGEVYYPSGWMYGPANFDIAYEYGFDFPPPRVSQAALLWAKNFLVKGPIDDRTTSVVSEDGTFALSTPGMRGATTGIPEVDAVINQYSMVVGVA